MSRLVIDNHIATGKVTARVVDADDYAFTIRYKDTSGKTKTGTVFAASPRKAEEKLKADKGNEVAEILGTVGNSSDADAPGMVRSDDLQCDVSVATLTKKKLQEIYNDPKRPAEERNAARREFEARGANDCGCSGSCGCGSHKAGDGFYTKEQTHYHIARPGEPNKCGNCQHFKFPNGCKIVDGLVSADGWCDQYKRVDGVVQ